jgi:Pectate lyase superfamily protein
MKFSEFVPATSPPALTDELVGFIVPAAPGSNRRWTLAQTAQTTNRYNSVINAKDFGASGDGITDDAAALQNAIDFLYAHGGGTLWLSAATYICNTALAVLPNVTVRGANRDASVLKTNVTGNGVLTTHGLSQSGYGEVSDLTAWGYADRSAVQGGQDLINIGPFKSTKISNVRAQYAQARSMVAGTADFAEITGCYVFSSLRDGIDASAVTEEVSITNNHIVQCGDDAIACHVANSNAITAWNRRVVITGNRIEKSYGIKCLGLQNAVINNNTLRFYTGYGIFLGADPSFHQGENPEYNLAIIGNTFTDHIDPTLIGGGVQNICISLNFQRLQDGLAVLPEEFNAATHAFRLPEPYMNNFAALGVGPACSHSNIVIQGNVARQTLSGLTNFADAGYGNLWNNAGSQNPAMSSNLFKPFFCVVQGDVNGLLIANNSVEAVAGFVSADTQKVQRGWIISGNNVRRISNNGIYLAPLSGTISSSVLIQGNNFDLDPYCESAARVHDGSGNPTGAWSATDGSTMFGVWADIGAMGVIIIGNTFANCRRPTKASNTDFFAQIMRNFYYWDWSTGTNLGIAAIDIEMGENLSFFRYSDPRAVNYGQEETTFLGDWTSQPNQGYWRRGMFVTNKAPVLAGGKVTIGWTRLTNGNAHVANTDWAAAVVPNA